MTELAGVFSPKSDDNGAGDAAIDSGTEVPYPVAVQLLRIASQLRRIAGMGGATADRTAVSAQSDAPPESLSLTLARKLYALRRKRAAIFGEADLFGEPAWDILLDLYIAHGEGKPVSVSSACIGSAAPSTTGLRWLGILVDVGLVLREHDPADQRRVLVRLSDQGKAAMERFLAAAAAALG